VCGLAELLIVDGLAVRTMSYRRQLFTGVNNVVNPTTSVLHTSSSSSSSSSSPPSKELPEFNIAILGALGVGKSGTRFAAATRMSSKISSRLQCVVNSLCDELSTFSWPQCTEISHKHDIMKEFAVDDYTSVRVAECCNVAVRQEEPSIVKFGISRKKTVRVHECFRD